MNLFKHAERNPASILKDSSFKLAKMSIQDRITQAIGQSGQSKSAIAKACGVQPSAVSQWLSGDTKAPTAERLLKLARATGVSYTWLIDGKGSMTDSSQAARRHEIELHDAEFVEGDEPLRSDEIDLPCFREVEFSAGDGRAQVIENHGASMRFNLSRLARAGVQPDCAACATVSGTSMEPTIANGSPIAIDKSTTHIVDGKIYALEHGGELRVKRLYRMPLNRLRLVSDNADEYPEEVYMLGHEDAPRILGRVFWWEVFD